MYFKRLFYMLLFSGCSFNSLFAQNIQSKESQTGIDFVSKGNVLLTYHTAMTDVPAGVKEAFRKSGFIHPLKSPSGQVLTRIQPPDHYHHYGIWGPWTRTIVQGREVDFWNLGDGTGRVDFNRVISRTTQNDFAAVTVRQDHIDLKAPGGAQVAIEEDLTIRVGEVKDKRYSIDYQTVISTPLGSPVVLEAYRYGGGIGFRATERWGTDNSRVLTSEGHDRKTADGSFAKWVMVSGESDDPSGQSGILFLSHPQNRAHPEPMRVWPEDQYEGKGNVFVEFCPIRHEAWEIQPGQKQVLTYRMIVFDGSLSAKEAEAYWQDFAALPQTITQQQP